MPTSGYVYLLASQRNGTLYTGVTSDLVRRVAQHRSGSDSGFTSTYGVTRLVYVEAHADIRDAIRREKQIKKWRRAWKLRLIEADNPAWRDLYPDWCEALTRSRPAFDPDALPTQRVIPAEAGIQNGRHPAQVPGSPPPRG